MNDRNTDNGLKDLQLWSSLLAATKAAHRHRPLALIVPANDRKRHLGLEPMVQKIGCAYEVIVENSVVCGRRWSAILTTPGVNAASAWYAELRFRVVTPGPIFTPADTEAALRGRDLAEAMARATRGALA